MIAHYGSAHVVYGGNSSDQRPFEKPKSLPPSLIFAIDCLSERTNGKLILFVPCRTPLHCPHPKEEGEAEAVGEAEAEGGEGSACFGRAGSTRGTLTALSTTASL